MSGIIPEDEEEEQEVYDDVGQIDEDIYEELPGLILSLYLYSICCPSDHEDISCISLIYIYIFFIISVLAYFTDQ